MSYAVGFFTQTMVVGSTLHFEVGFVKFFCLWILGTANCISQF